MDPLKYNFDDLSYTVYPLILSPISLPSLQKSSEIINESDFACYFVSKFSEN